MTNPTNTAGEEGTGKAFARLRAAILSDPEYAWGWHCNVAMPIYDALGISHEQANKAAAAVMGMLFDCDVTTHPEWQRFVDYWTTQDGSEHIKAGD